MNKAQHTQSITPRMLTSGQHIHPNRDRFRRALGTVFTTAGDIAKCAARHPILTFMAFVAIPIAVDRAVFAVEPETTVVASGPVAGQSGIKIPLEKLNRLDREYRGIRDRLRDNATDHINTIDVDFNGKYLMVKLSMCKQPGCNAPDGDVILDLIENGKVISGFGINGININHARLILENGATSFTVHVVVKDNENGPLRSDMPVISARSDGNTIVPAGDGVIAMQSMR